MKSVPSSGSAPESIGGQASIKLINLGYLTDEYVLSGTAPAFTGSIADKNHSRAWAVADKYHWNAPHLMAGIVMSTQQVFSALLQCGWVDH